MTYLKIDGPSNEKREKLLNLLKPLDCDRATVNELEICIISEEDMIHEDTVSNITHFLLGIDDERE